MEKWCFVLLILLAACADQQQPAQQSCIDEDKIDTEAACTMEYRPVCGCDGNTYSNACVAENAGLLDWKEGVCDETN